MLDDAQAHLGSMVENLMSSISGETNTIYRVGLQTNALLESVAEVVIAWQLLRHAEIAVAKAGDDPFYEGKVSSARWFLADVAPKVSSRKDAALAEDGALMDLPVEAF